MLHKRSLRSPSHIPSLHSTRRPFAWLMGSFNAVGKNTVNAAYSDLHIAAMKSVRQPSCPAASRSDSALFRHPGELDLNLREYMVVLEKPVGLTLAPDPQTGQVVVQDIRTNSPAHKCGLIQVGDVIRSCSAVFGDDMWLAADIRRVRWAINSRMGDVKLILERSRRGHGATTAWYCGGKAGVATRERDGMQLPYSFNNSTPDDAGSFLDLPGPGKAMQVAFHRNTITQPPPSRKTSLVAAARAKALQRLRRELLEARGMARLDLSSSLPRPGSPDGFVLPPAATTLGPRTTAATTRPTTIGPGGGGGGRPPPPVVDVIAPALSTSTVNDDGDNGGGMPPGIKLGGGSNGTAVAAAAAAAAVAAAASSGGSGGAAKERRVVNFLPWLLVSCGRLEHRHIAQIASCRSLGALLELSLTRAAPQPQPQPQPQPLAQPQGQNQNPSQNLSQGQGAGQNQNLGSANGVPSGSGAGAESSTNTPNSNGVGGSSSASGGGAGGSNSGSGGSKGGYLVVRGSDLLPLVSDVGRVSYQTLLAAAAAAAASGNGTGATPPPPSPPGEAPPPPPPGSAAATAAMINGSDVVAADCSSLIATGLSSPPGSGLGSSGSTTNDNGNGNGGSGGNAASGKPGGSGGSSNGSRETAGPSPGMLGSGTMAFLNRSIFLNLRPSPTAAAGNKMAFNGSSAELQQPAGPSSSSSSAAAAANANGNGNGNGGGGAVFSALPTSRYDPVRVRHLLNAAASLQRLAFRRGGRMHRARPDQCAVLLHCDEGMEGDVAVLLAGWLHWFGGLPLQEAILTAETSMGTAVDQGLLEAGTAALLQGARERCSRVVLTWKYGGLSAYVAGDVVASWSARVPMLRCRSPLGCKGDTHRGHFYLEVQGLRPGVYYYKYIVDGTWAVDSLSSKVLDSAGNWNNVLVVPEPPQVLTSREGLTLARWQAGRLAFEAKMGLPGSGR